jgi:predicted AlkP superfamily phosphohydrolase/phosphomutase
MIRALAWGAFWALAAGFWLLGRLIVSTHRLIVDSAGDAVAVVAALCLLFAFIGSVIGAFVYGVRRLIEGATRRSPADSAWATTITSGIFLVPAYVIMGCAIYTKRFGGDGAAEWSLDALRLALPAMIGIAALVAGLHFATAGSLKPRRVRIATGVALAAFIGGVTALVLQLPEVAGAAKEAVALKRVGVTVPKAPLLIVGIDGGTWRPIEPLIRDGRLPRMASLMASGSHGDIAALWPPYWSTTAWSAIVTGLPREEVGVYGNLVVDAPGLPAFQAPLDIDPRLVLVSAIEYALAYRHFMKAAPPERSALKRPPIWEMLHKSEVKTAVVRFNFTYPAGDQASIVISNRVVPDVWDMLGVESAEPSGMAWPDSLRDSLLIPFNREWAAPVNEHERVFPQKEWPKPADSHLNPVRTMNNVLSFDQRTMIAVRDLIQSHPDIEVVIVHLGGLDNVQHLFWQYSFPEDFSRKPAAADVEALGPVIGRYLEFIDRGIGEIIDAFPVDPNVMIVSDHGIESVENKPPFKGWHSSPGIYIAAGPDMPARSERLTVSYYDIAPTILELRWLEIPSNLRGRVIGRAEAMLARQ